MRTMSTNPASRSQPFQRGLSLIELLVALAIGSFLIIGAVTMQSQTRRSFDVNEQQARLQESARYVLSTLEPELQLSGLYAFAQDPNVVMFANGATLTPPNNLRQDDPAVTGVPASLDACGTNFALDVISTVEAYDADYTPPVAGCAVQGGGHIAGADTLILRRASTIPTVANAARLQIYGNRLSPHTSTRMFVGATAPDPIVAGTREVRNMIVNVYYIAADADGRPGTPALRVKLLDTDGVAPAFIDQEMIRGIEDLQVQFGVDPGADLDGDGIPDDPGNDGMADFVNGFAARYVNPGDAILTSAQVVAVRVWVRVRADQPEQGFIDDRAISTATWISRQNDNFRRVLMSRTIFLRNSRQQ